ncbi:MAG TPA: apolipoprotein N-acyltransferase [Candidatus Dormibacteraeota bacterium]|nr:apolipoprotein N-acyltransferase [Candidatus Dormibacteraeota bacterium]
MSKRVAFVVGSGVLLALAFPEPHWSPLAWLALAPLLIVALEARPAAAFAWGFLQGAIFYAITLEWLYGFFCSYGGMSVVASVAVLGLLVAFLSLFTGAYALGVRLMRRSGAGWALAVSPFLWVALELIRTRVPVLGFPWNLLGYAVSDRLALVQMVTITGIYGLSFVVAGYNALLLWAWRRRSGKKIAIWSGVTAFLALVIVFGPRLVPKPAGRFAAHLVQVNLRPQENYSADWDRKHAAQLAELERLSVGAGRSAPGLIVWPEAPAPFSMQDPAFAARAREIARQGESDFLAGVDWWSYPPGRPVQVFNSAVMVNPAGQTVFRYDKIHLVPFGEYVPWRKWLFFARNLIGGIGDFTPGTKLAVGPLEGRRFSVFICYEAVFPNEVRQFADRGAELFINISDDGWYGRSEALEQHLNMVRVRAVENRRWLLRDTNTGLTAAIDPYGRIRARLPADRSAALTVRYNFRSDRTLYTRWGDWWAELSLLVAGAALVWNFARRSRTG